MAAEALPEQAAAEGRALPARRRKVLRQRKARLRAAAVEQPSGPPLRRGLPPRRVPRHMARRRRMGRHRRH
ncbi:MAG TPA: hypothetical protein VNS02_03025 [Rhizobiaceae bacterium]|nr:hypothetical protein [Rhizobiaceae bacterium]